MSGTDFPEVAIGVVLGSSRPQRLGDRVCQFPTSQTSQVSPESS
jgi:hypothetical protein